MWSLPRSLVLGAYIALSLFTFLLTERVVSTAVLQAGVLIGFGALLTGIGTRRPDAEVLAWLILGTTTLVCEAESPLVAFWAPMATAALVVLMADLDHSIAIFYPRVRDEVIGDDQAASRRRLLTWRAGRLGASGAAALILALLGTSLAPPLLIAGSQSMVVGILGATALILLTAVVWARKGN